MSKRSANDQSLSMNARALSGYQNSLVRCAVAILVAIVGIAWIVVYDLGPEKKVWAIKQGGTIPKTSLGWMADMTNWNYLIGFGLVLLAMIIAAHRGTPLGRGRGVVVGMLFCFLFGLAWVVTYYMTSGGTNPPIRHIPAMKDLDQYNLLVGVAFMAVGFSFATKWE